MQAPPFGSKNNIFRGNVVSANTTFGIQDLSFAKTNAYYANQAKNNGPTPATTNYSGAGVFPTAPRVTLRLSAVLPRKPNTSALLDPS